MLKNKINKHGEPDEREGFDIDIDERKLKKATLTVSILTLIFAGTIISIILNIPYIMDYLFEH